MYIAMYNQVAVFMSAVLIFVKLVSQSITLKTLWVIMAVLYGMDWYEKLYGIWNLWASRNKRLTEKLIDT